MTIRWSLDAKIHFISSLCYKSVKLTFIYPTLTKRPAEIALPGCDNDNKWTRYLIWPENTLEPSNWLDILWKVIKNDIYCLFCQQNMIKTRYFLIKKNTQKKTIINFNILSTWIMLVHTFSWSYEHLVVIGCKKHLISSLCYKSWNWPFHLPHPH